MIGFRQRKEERNLIKNQKPVIVHNVKELEKIGKGEIAIIGNIGNKKKIEIIKKAKEKKIQVSNLNINKILKKIEKKEMKKKETKTTEKKK